ncbi:LytTR family DNA-binding domain-containing protein [Clostridium sp. SHJSY1]|uniref:LytR/AlgR family response regulator transcription factor n=1 Tax=Clostridium sp. SHJSY1 TaxID=2942483 RepID=UPI0028771FA4|nr:LytTR family DNA-binding domain-containing protein [Clostridium sp. SHJSY1]MDS0527228.1 LytTR family DNA-binding domain-containing protein [Clostridium sp. SHJSY1]
MYSIILVEDDFMQRDILKRMINSMYEFVEIYEADNESDALDIIKKYNINMFLIDINLKESSGLELAINIRKIYKYQFSQIIFLTSHVEYITQAFKQTHCYDYILKPYNKKEVQAMLNKIIMYENEHLNNIENEEKDKEIIITLKNGIYLSIKIDDIVFIEVKGKNCEINTINRIYDVNNISLKKMIKLIDCKYIIQSHRAFIVNRNYIHKIEKLDNKLSVIQFDNYSKTALLGYKFKDCILSEFKKGKVEIC